MRAVSDTGPIHYLILIGLSDLLAQLFTVVEIPEAIRGELTEPETPAIVRQWMSDPPGWLHVQKIDAAVTPVGQGRIHHGERAAIALALQNRPDLLLMDDRAGVAVAEAFGIDVVGTLELLRQSAIRGLIDLEIAFEALGRTNFRWTPSLRDFVMRRYHQERP